MRRRTFVRGLASLALAPVAMSLSSCGTPQGDASPADASPDAAQPAEVLFSHDPGAYADAAIDLGLSSENGNPVVYTTDGSVPTASSAQAKGAVRVDASDTNAQLIELLAAEIPDWRSLSVRDDLPTATVIRAAELATDGSLGPTGTSTYFMDTDLGELYGQDMVVISIVADPHDLLDPETGIMAMGTLYEEHRAENEEAMAQNRGAHVVANYTQTGRDWERPALIQAFDCSNQLSFEAPCGIRLRGHDSRKYSQKSFNVYFRSDYGQKRLEYPLFGEDNVSERGAVIDSYKGFSLRAGGNATELMSFRDSLYQRQVRDYAIATQATRPAIAYLNGEFYGVYSLNEKYSGAFVESHYGVADDNVVIFEQGELDEGVDEDVALYEELMTFGDHDLSDVAAWEEFLEAVDIESMVDYYAIQTYLGNADCNDKLNTRVWRAREPEDGNPFADTRWRWMLYDIEFSSCMYGIDKTQPQYDTLTMMMEKTRLLKAAMRNVTFRALMRERLVDLGTGPLSADTMTRAIDETWALWEPWMSLMCLRFCNRWNEIEGDRDGARRFFSKRLEHILDNFDRLAEELAAGE